MLIFADAKIITALSYGLADAVAAYVGNMAATGGPVTPRQSPRGTAARSA
jgi:hypothetical protein